MKKILILLTAFIFLSCNPMKKNVMKDRADDVKEAVVLKNNEGSFLIIKEEVFQAYSKSDDRGFRRISGYAEYRISSYDLNTGQLVKRIELGDREENECYFLGKAAGKLWYKSVNPDLGIHARDPKTLDVVISEKMILDENPLLEGKISQPKWNEVQRYYGFNMLRIMPAVSDNDGFIYYIDPVTLKAEKTQESIENFKYDNSCTSTSMEIDANSYVNLSGNPRNSVSYFNRESKDPSFLEGEFIMSSNNLTSEELHSGFLSPHKEKISELNHHIDSLKKIFGDADTNAADGRTKVSQEYNYRNLKRNIQYAEADIKRAEDDLKRDSEDEYFGIVTPDNGVFVLSQTDVTDKAKVVISKVSLNKDSTVSLAWQTQLGNVFRDPDKGFDQSSFDFVFSKGDPELNTMRSLFADNKLVFIYMLTATCIDASTGSVLWSIEI